MMNSSNQPHPKPILHVDVPVYDQGQLRRKLLESIIKREAQRRTAKNRDLGPSSSKA
jgi:hypothetical protein